MAKINPLTNIWAVVKEADLRPIREQAERGVRIAIVGAPGAGRSTLAEQMLHDPARPGEPALGAPVVLYDLASASNIEGYDLVILMLDGNKSDTRPEQELVRAWHARDQRTLVFVNYAPAQLPAGNLPPTQAAVITTSTGAGAALPPPKPAAPARSRGVVRGSVYDQNFLMREFAQAVLELIPEHSLALGRCFPFFRVPVARYMINDTSFSNAAYAFSTALAETVPVISVPIALTDMIILTKNQLFLVYKLGLALGYSTRWQDYAGEFGGVLGSGFLWRQIARTLVGLIPVWGIIPKTAISYAGTFAVGNAVLQWYLTGRQISAEQVKLLYTSAFDRGKQVAAGLLKRGPQALKRLPKPRLPQIGKPRLALPRLPGRKSTTAPAEQTASAELTPSAAMPALPPHTCSKCGRVSAGDARFCQYCGNVFVPAADAEASRRG